MNSLDLDLKKMTNTKQMGNNQQQDSIEDIDAFLALLRLWEKSEKTDDGYIHFRISEFVEEIVNEVKTYKCKRTIIVDVDHAIKSLHRLSEITIQLKQMRVHLIDSYSTVKNKDDAELICKVKLSDKVIELLKSKGVCEAERTFVNWFIGGGIITRGTFLDYHWPAIAFILAYGTGIGFTEVPGSYTLKQTIQMILNNVKESGLPGGWGDEIVTVIEQGNLKRLIEIVQEIAGVYEASLDELFSTIITSDSPTRNTKEEGPKKERKK